MKLPPLWKVKRELRRVKEKVDHLVHRAIIDPRRQARYDRLRNRMVKETRGQQDLTSRVAVFVLFQPRGIAASTLLTLRHLATEDWSVVIVVNSVLTDADRSQLATHCAQIIERPNVGYDFGAYREGWFWLDRNGFRPDRLILMNDSTWFPIRAKDDTLRRMEGLNADLAGHIFKSESAQDTSRDHVESHLLMFSGAAIRHPSIRHFWSNYVMSDLRALTIGQGEKGLTQAAIGAGLKVDALLGRDRLVALLSALPEADLLSVLRNLVFHSAAGRQMQADLLAAAQAGRPWRDQLLGWTHTELSGSPQHLVSVTFLDPAMSLGGMGFLKKSSERRFQLARLAALRGIEAGRIAPMDPVVEAEVRSAIAAWEPPSDWRTNPKDLQVAEL
jgi:hypothetical protein